MTEATGTPIETWHRFLATRDWDLLEQLLDEDAVFHSPVVHTPQAGRPLVMLYLRGAAAVLGNDSFQYLRQIVGANDALLEFTAEVDGIHINGVDLIHWNDAGRITDFKVMVRPLKAIQVLHQKMREMLESLQQGH